MMRLLLLMMMISGPALAHGADGDAAPDWEWDIFVVAPLAISAMLYCTGVCSLWRRAGVGRGIRVWQATAFGAAWLTVFGSLCSPLHWYAEQLFSAHMLEHELLMAVAAPLFAVSRPIGAFMRAMPKSWRSGISRLSQSGMVARPWQIVIDPAVATIVHAVALWAWHAPGLFEAAVQNETWHRLQHVSFFGSALIFWWALFRRPRHALGHGSMHVFATMTHMTLLGALLTLAPHVLYPVQTATAERFGWTPLEDQQLGGLIMWIPAGTIYAAIGVAMLGLWITRASPVTASQRA